MKPVALLLAHGHDSGAAAVARWLGRHAPHLAVRCIRPEALGVARWSHRVDARGRASTSVMPPCGEPLASDCIAVALHRIHLIPIARFRNAAPRDRDYAAAEMQALVASWLAGLGDRALYSLRRHPVLSGIPGPAHWKSVAALHGLRVAEDGMGSGTTRADVLVSGERAAGALASRFGDACRAVAQALALPLLAFRFEGTTPSEAVVSVDPQPPLLESWEVEEVGRLVLSRAGDPSA